MQWGRVHELTRRVNRRLMSLRASDQSVRRPAPAEQEVSIVCFHLLVRCGVTTLFVNLKYQHARHPRPHPPGAVVLNFAVCERTGRRTLTERPSMDGTPATTSSRSHCSAAEPRPLRQAETTRPRRRPSRKPPARRRQTCSRRRLWAPPRPSRSCAARPSWGRWPRRLRRQKLRSQLCLAPLAFWRLTSRKLHVSRRRTWPTATCFAEQR